MGIPEVAAIISILISGMALFISWRAHELASNAALVDRVEAYYQALLVEWGTFHTTFFRIQSEYEKTGKVETTITVEGLILRRVQKTYSNLPGEPLMPDSHPLFKVQEDATMSHLDFAVRVQKLYDAFTHEQKSAAKGIALTQQAATQAEQKLDALREEIVRQRGRTVLDEFE